MCEPRDDIKGEIARALFYMAIRYDGVNDQSFTSGAETWLDLEVEAVAQSKEMLLQWSDAHPPTAAEIARDAVITSYQGIVGEAGQKVVQPCASQATRSDVHTSSCLDTFRQTPL